MIYKLILEKLQLLPAPNKKKCVAVACVDELFGEKKAERAKKNAIEHAKPKVQLYLYLLFLVSNEMNEYICCLFLSALITFIFFTY